MDRRTMIESMMKSIATGLALNATTVMAETLKEPEQSQQMAPRGRKPVIPQQVIDEFRMQPTEGYGLWVMGEDGKPYSLDEVLSVLFVIVRAHWGGDQPRGLQAAPKRKEP